MDAKFVNRTKRDKALAKEFNFYMHFQRTIPIFINIFLLFYFLIGVCLFPYIRRIEFIIIPPIFWLFIIILYLRRVDIMVKRLEELDALNAEIEAIVEEEKIVYVSEKSIERREVPLEKIRYAVQTKNYIFLFSKAKFAHILSKNGFTVGSSDEFVAFLRRNGIKVKGKRQ